MGAAAAVTTLCCAPEGKEVSQQLLKDDLFSEEVVVAQFWEVGAGKDVKVQQDACVFVAELEAQDQEASLGLCLDLIDGCTLYVENVLDDLAQPVLAYNARSPPEHQLTPCTHILKVNGVHGDLPRMLEIMKSLDGKTMVCRRPLQFSLEVPKNGHGLGLDLQYARTGTTLTVSNIHDGAVKMTGADIRVGDRILKVNHVTGSQCSPQQMLVELIGSDRPVLYVSRCPEVVEFLARRQLHLPLAPTPTVPARSTPATHNLGRHISPGHQDHAHQNP